MLKGLFLMCLFLMSSGFSHEAEKELLIVSCGGGGTHYTAKCLNAAGIAVGHEEVGSYGYVGWPFTVGPYWCTGEFLYKPSFKHTFHQVRHPLNVISSWASISWGAKLNNPVYSFAEKFLK